MLMAALLSVTLAGDVPGVRMEDSYLDTTARFSTYGYQVPPTTLGASADSFLRAWVNKTTGQAAYQLYASVYYYGDWAFLTTANYVDADGPHQKELNIIGRKVGSCSRYTRSCALYEDVGLDLTEDQLKFAASREGAFRFRLNAKNGQSTEGVINAREASLLLKEVEAYRYQIELRKTPMVVSPVK